MKKQITLFLICAFAVSSTISGQTKEELKKGVSFIDTDTYSQDENLELLKLYKDLRVADLSDGMDKVGLANTGLVDPAIHPHWTDYDDLSHIIRGIAVTARYVPTQRPNRPGEGQDFDEWVSSFYSNYSTEAFIEVIKEGSVVVLDDVEGKDIGSIGSNNIMIWKRAGAVGVVTDAASRDVDEIAIQKVPLYLRHTGRGIRPGRNELESVNMPVVIGGVLVRPGDVVVADGDGVIVVPRKVAREVAEYAHGVLEKDKEGRRRLYESLGLPMDQTVK